MRKSRLITMVMVVVVSLTGCSQNNKKDNISKTETTKQNVESVGEAKNEESTKADPLEEELSDVCDRAIYLMYNVLSVFYLPYGDEPIKDSMYPVESTEFKSVEEIKSYIKQIYTEKGLKEALAIVDEVYADVDGKLCINVEQTSARIVNENWDNFKLKDIRQQDEKCTFTICGRVEEFGEEIKIEECEKELKAINVDGKWLLTDLF
ncbi:MAG: hypothetical protein IKN54_07935 [Lachnospiraceae bacterium]|nr:hypothetical protein [Lachnospiraceae bacterium]